MEARAVVVLPHTAAPPPWSAALAAVRRVVAGEMSDERVGALLRDAECALVDGTAADPVSLAHHIHRLDASLQVAVVVAAEDRLRVERAVLFTPGLGEIWLVTPQQVDPALVERAAAVTRQRRAYRATHARLEHDLSGLERRGDRRAVISDAYLATLLAVLPDPVLSLDDESCVLSWNSAAERVLGYRREEAVGRPLAELVEGMYAPALLRLLDDPGAAVREEIRFRRADGEEGVAELAAVPVEAGGHRVRAVLLHDVTEQRLAQAELEAQTAELELQTEELQGQAIQLEEAHTELEVTNEALERERLAAQSAARRLETVLRQMPSGVILAEAPTGRMILGNEQVERIWRRPFLAAAEVGEYQEYEGFHPDGRPYAPAEWPLTRALMRGETVLDEEIRIRRGDGTFGVISVGSAPIRDAEGRVVAAVAIFDDITERREREEEDAFLAEAARVLASSLDYRETLHTVARLAVPRVADWCAVDVLEEGAIQRLAVVHSDPDKERLGYEIPRRWPPDPNGTTGLPNVLRTGQPELYPEISDAVLQRLAQDEEHLRILRSIGLRSGMVVPMVARGRTLGAISLVAAESGRRYGAAELAFAERLAAHAALALDNARLLLHAEQAREEAVQAQLQAEEARREAEAANRAKSDFLANMSHEIRTPINAVMGYADLMDMGIGGEPTEVQRDYLRHIRASNQHLLGLINEILDLAKIESGRMEVLHERARAVDAVAAALALVGPQAASRGIEIRNPCEHDVEVDYVGDEDRVRQIVANLVGNAVKFTGTGGVVTVTCGYADRADATSAIAEEGPWTYIRVQDTGIGIEADQLERIFRPFVQAEGGYTRQTGGTGLGLSISRQLALLMGGDITVVSRPGEGSTFTLWLPRERALDEAVLAEAHGGDPPSGLAEAASALLRELEPVLAAYRRRLREDPLVPTAADLGDADLDDHQATFLSDLAASLSTLEDSRVLPDQILRDGGEIQSVLAELHGRQRAHLGWTEEGMRREFVILREEVEQAVRRGTTGSAVDVEGALELLGRYLDRAARVSLRGYRVVANSLRR